MDLFSGCGAGLQKRRAAYLSRSHQKLAKVVEVVYLVDNKLAQCLASRCRDTECCRQNQTPKGVLVLLNSVCAKLNRLSRLIANGSAYTASRVSRAVFAALLWRQAQFTNPNSGQEVTPWWDDQIDYTTPLIKWSIASLCVCCRKTARRNKATRGRSAANALKHRPSLHACHFPPPPNRALHYRLRAWVLL